MAIEAGIFELNGITGVSLAAGGDVLGIRMAAPHPTLGLFDDKDVLLTMEGPDTLAPDLSYVKVAWRVPVSAAGLKRFAGWPRKSVNAPTVYDFAPGEAVTVTLEWRFDGQVVSGRYTADAPVRLGLFANGCFTPGEVEAATPAACRLALGGQALLLALQGPVDEPLLIDTRLQAEQRWAGVPVDAGTAMALYPVALTPAQPLHFAMTLAPRDAEAPMPLVDPAEINLDLHAGAACYAAMRMRSTGDVARAAEAIAALAGYSRTYDPQRARLMTTVNRTWGGPNSPGLIFGWDNFFDSYLAAWEDPALGAASLEHIVGVYGERGIEHGPVQRNLIIPIMYCRTLDILDDEHLARRTWPTMMAFMRFWFADRGDGRAWRDGNGDGLIESGTCKDPRDFAPGCLIAEAMDETGYDELPLYSAGFTDGRRGMLAPGVRFDSESQSLTVTLVCQNSLYIAAARTMARWADRLGEDGDAWWLRAEADRVAALMRDRLFNDAEGIFRDRYWEGGFSPVTVMTVFYPLLAGVADPAVQERLKALLLDPRKFWGDNLVPTVSRDDPAYCDGIDGQGNYWRGNIWAPTSYIVYLAIKEAGWDEVAAEYARRTHALFMEYWEKYGHAYENYPAEGKVNHRFLYVGNWGGRELRYVWAGMLLFCGLEEVFAPEAVRPGVRFGNPYLHEETAWTGFTFGGQRVDAVAGPARTEVRTADWHVHATPGVAVRAFRREDDALRCTITAPHEVRISLTAAGLLPEVRLNGNTIPATRDGDAVVFTVPVGEHAVEVG